jgi:hypothetical protein
MTNPRADGNAFVIVVGCTKSKMGYACPAEEMYSKSHLFKKTVVFIKSNYYTEYLILSAKYGIISPSDIIEPYEVKMGSVIPTEILVSIRTNLSDYNKIIAFCGSNYVNAMRKAFPTKCIVEPLRGLGIGKRLQFLNEVYQQ